MLFTDGIFITTALLNQIDGEFSAVAAAESVDTTSYISEAVNSAGNELIGTVQSFSGYLVGVGANANMAAAVLNVLSTAINRPRALLNQISVTEPNPTRTAMRRWIQYYVLFEFYTMLSDRKVKDRYEKKAARYEKQKKRNWENLKGCGFPVVVQPLPCPGAILEYNSGTWTTSNVAAVSGGSAAAAVSYDVAITWTNSTGYVNSANQGNCESAGSTIVTISVGVDQFLQVNITGLNPPNGTLALAIGSAQGVYSPLAATNWNIYVGLTGGTLYLQNPTPIAVGTATYTFAGAPNTASTGFPLPVGQAADYDFSFMNMLWRA